MTFSIVGQEREEKKKMTNAMIFWYMSVDRKIEK